MVMKWVCSPANEGLKLTVMVSQWNSHEWSLEVKPYSAFTAAFDPQIASSAEAPTRILGTELLAAHVKFGCMTSLELCYVGYVPINPALSSFYVE